MLASPKMDCSVLIAESERLLCDRRLPEAIASFRAGEAAGADPDRCSAGLWMAHMLSGDFEGAWRESDSIRGRGNPDPNRFWNGQSMAGKRVIVRCLHGYGDAVQFLRYLPLLHRIASHIILEVPPRLLDLAQYFDGACEVITWGEQAPLRGPVWDLQVEIMELPYIFRTQPAELPIAVNYLRPPQGTATQPVGAQADRTLHVGIVATAGSWDSSRSIPFHLLDPLFTISDCEFWNLESTPFSNEKNCSHLAGKLHVDESARDTIVGLARTVACLDMVITVDTLAAHLAGAMGIPAYLLLQYAADWRWMHQRKDSPWYPSLRLFRQPEPGDWHSVILSIHKELLTEVQQKKKQVMQACLIKT